MARDWSLFDLLLLADSIEAIVKTLFQLFLLQTESDAVYYPLIICARNSMRFGQPTLGFASAEPKAELSK